MPRRSELGALVGLSVLIGAAGQFTNGVPPAGGSAFPTTIPLTGAERLPADTGIASPPSESIGVGQLTTSVGGSAGQWVNALRGGDFGENLFQRGTSLSGLSAGPAYGADGWVAWGGTGFYQNDSTSPPQGYLHSWTIGRTAGNASLTPICLGQEVPSPQAVRFAGKLAEFRLWLETGANFSGSGVQLLVVTGTGTDEGTSAMVAGTWTGFASSSSTISPTPGWGAYSTLVNVPASVTELGVEVCWTPTGTALGADSLSVDGLGLAVDKWGVAASGSAGAASALLDMSRRSQTEETQEELSFRQGFSEPAAGVIVGTGQAKSTTVCEIRFVLAPAMYKSPSYTNVLSGTTFEILNSAGASHALLTPFSTAVVLGTKLAIMDFTTSGLTTGSVCSLAGAGGSGQIVFSSEL